MNTPKPFDCVQAKCDIQQSLLKEYEGLTLEQRRELMARKIAADPVLGPWFSSVQKQTQFVAQVAETRSGYGNQQGGD